MAESLHVLIGGGSGWIARNLRRKLLNRGHQVTLVDRNPPPNQLSWREFSQDPLIQNAILLASSRFRKPVNAVISLAGSPIMEKTWTPHTKKELRDSRIWTTTKLAQHVKAIPYDESEKPSVFIVGSAVGIYDQANANPDYRYDEDYSGPYQLNEFAPKLCFDNEEAMDILQDDPSIRCVKIRTSVVLGRDGGVLSKLMIPGGIFCLGQVGSGLQWYPWIHIEDLTELFIHAIQNKSTGLTINGVAPGLTNQAEFTRQLAKSSRRWPVPLPEWITKLLFQERASMLTRGCKVVPLPNTNRSHFQFKFPSLEEALDDIYTDGSK